MHPTVAYSAAPMNQGVPPVHKQEYREKMRVCDVSSMALSCSPDQSACALTVRSQERIGKLCVKH